MSPESKNTLLNLQNLELISRGDSFKKLMYLKQFQELIPERLELLKTALEKEDRIAIRQIVHKMSPQLLFFGIKDIDIPIQRLEYEHKTMNYFELEVIINDIISKLEGSLFEISNIIATDFE